MRIRILMFTLLLPAAGVAAEANCWTQAGQRYGVDPALLVAIAKTESSLNPLALNRNRGARGESLDIGLMQINSQWWPTLARFGIEPEHLWDACTSIHVGAWILANNLARADLWTAVGAYNAGWKPERSTRRNEYAWRVYRHLAGH